MFNTLSYIFDENSISEFKLINGVKIPFTLLADLHLICKLIPNRDVKVNMIEKYILKNGLEKQELLKIALDGCLPVNVRLKINNILSA